MSKNVPLRVCLRSGKGRLRKNNEDNYYVNGVYSDLAETDVEKRQSYEFSEGNTLFAVSDGMGGIENGEFAAYIACKQLSSLFAFLENEPYAEALQKWITQTNRLISTALKKGGCTLAMVFVEEGALHASNVGDSRVYRFSDKRLMLLSKDHSKVQLMVDAGILTPAEADIHPQKNIITRYLGMNESLVGTCAPHHSPVQKIISGDRYLICSDGLSDMLPDKQIEDIMIRYTELDECADCLYESALEAGGKDNLTLLLIQFTK